MQLHEYQAKNILNEHNVPIPFGKVASSDLECEEIAKSINGRSVIKAQVHAGGRGKAGGIKVTEGPEEAKKVAQEMLGSTLKTFQSGGTEFPINKVYVEEASDISREFYIAVTMDFDEKCPVIIFSTEGGMNIEEVAEKTPEKIIKIHVNPLIGPSPYKLRNLLSLLKLEKKVSQQIFSIIQNLYEIFNSLDCTLIEINPLAVTKKEKVLALDAKITIDDDSIFRHSDLEDLFDKTQMNQAELKALSSDLAYIKLDGGKVGCMVNGAGLAMATMDITIKAGTAPANFLDVGGSASEERIEEAYKIIASDRDVEIILVNLFGGILRCDVAAKGIINGFKESNNSIPMVAVLRGTNSNDAKLLLEKSALDISFAEDLPSAALEIRNKLGIS